MQEAKAVVSVLGVRGVDLLYVGVSFAWGCGCPVFLSMDSYTYIT